MGFVVSHINFYLFHFQENIFSKSSFSKSHTQASPKKKTQFLTNLKRNSLQFSLIHSFSYFFPYIMKIRKKISCFVQFGELCHRKNQKQQKQNWNQEIKVWCVYILYMYIWTMMMIDLLCLSIIIHIFMVRETHKKIYFTFAKYTKKKIIIYWGRQWEQTREFTSLLG